MAEMVSGAVRANQIADVAVRRRLAELAHFSRHSVAGELVASIAPIPLPVKADVVQLHQAIMSVVTNAMDAMSGSSVDQCMVFVATERMDNSAKVSVFDRGPGIPPDKLKEIFAPFFSTKKERMGMGLSITRTIVEAHGGQIWAENVPTGGAVFHISLPLATVH